MTGRKRSVLIAGAGFAGLASAWWLKELGYSVTVVEVAPGLRKGGTPVDIRDSVIDVIRRMGMLEDIRAASLPSRIPEFLDQDGSLLKPIASPVENSYEEANGWEIERDTLLDLLFDRIKHDVEFLFNNSIVSVDETLNGIAITLADGQQRSVALLLGCDGTHSALRAMCFEKNLPFCSSCAITSRSPSSASFSSRRTQLRYSAFPARPSWSTHTRARRISPSASLRLWRFHTTGATGISRNRS